MNYSREERRSRFLGRQSFADECGALAPLKGELVGDASRRSPLAPGVVVFSIAALLSCVAFYYVAVIRVDLEQTSLLDLGPQPDGQEYLAAAASVVRDGRFGIIIGNDFLPSRYPPGFSAFLVPLVFVLGPDYSVFAPYYANSLLGLLTITGVFASYMIQRRYVAAGVAVCLIVTLPTFITFARSSMSETLGTLLILCAFGLVSLGQKKDDYRPIVAAGACIGLAVATRTQLVLFGPLLAAVFFLGDGARPLVRVRQAVIVGFAFVAGIMPILWANWTATGNPLSSGYAFWLPGLSFDYIFSVTHIWPNLTSIWNELTLQPNRFTSANLFATGAYLTPPFMVLAAVASGVYVVRAGREARVPIACATLFFVVTSMYFFNSLRLYHPFWLLTVFPIARLCETLYASPAVTTASRIARGAIGATLVAAVLGAPSLAGYPPVLVASQSLRLAAVRDEGGWSRDYEAIMSLKRLDLEGPILLLTDIIPILGSTLLDQSFTVVPANNDHAFRYSVDWAFGDAEREVAISQAFDRRERVVFLTTFLPVDKTALRERLRLGDEDRLVDLLETPRAAVVEVIRYRP